MLVENANVILPTTMTVPNVFAFLTPNKNKENVNASF